MTPSLERLNELVRQAEAKSRSKKVEAEARVAAERLREAERRAREATQRLREGRPARLKQLEQADADEVHLKDVIKKLAQFKSSLDPDSDPEGLVDAARAEIDRSRREAKAALEELTRNADEARRALRGAVDHYQQLRRELDRLQPKLAESFAADDRVLWDAETLFPGGWIHGLAREVEAGAPFFGMLSRAEQYAQLKTWIGRYRQFQDEGDPEAVPGSAAEAEEAQAQAQRVFHQLKTLSKTHEPGYIDAFRLDFQADWPAYVAEAQAQLQQAVEAAKHAREREQQRGEQQARDAERLRQTRDAGRAALAKLRDLTDAGRRPAEDLDLAAFADELKKAVRGLGASDPDLLALAAPYREHVDGDDLRALRLNLDRAAGPEPDDAPDVARDEDLLSATRGLRALMVGGSVREDARASLESLFGFDRLEWEPYEESRPAALDSLEQRVRNGGVDLVLLLKGFLGHHVTDRLRPACQKSGVPCVLVERGYGPAQVGEALRRGLPKSA